MTDARRPPLRSASWFGRLDNAGFEHRTHLKARGAAPEMFDGRPVIGIANSASDLVPCNAHLTTLAEWVSRGVLENGGYPLVFPTMSIGEFDHAAQRHAVSQSHEHGARSPAAGQSARRCRPAHRLRQHGTRLHDGGRERRSADHRRAWRRDDQRLCRTTDGRLRHRHLQALRRFSRGQVKRIRLLGFRSQHVQERWPLQHHGHGCHDGVPGGSAWTESARLGRHSCGGRQAQDQRADRRPTCGRPGARGAHLLPHRRPPRARERHPRQCGVGRQHQRRPSSDRAGGAVGSEAHARRFPGQL